MAKNFIQFNNDRQRELAKEEREERIGKLLEKTGSNPDGEPKVFMQGEIQESKEITIDLNPLAKKFPIIPEEAGKLGKQLGEVLDSKIKMFVDRAILLAKKLGAIDESGNLMEEKLITDSETGKVMRITKFGKNPVMRFTNGKVLDSNKPWQQAVEFMIHLSDNKLSNTLNSKLDIKSLKQNLSLFEIKKVINI